MPNKVQVTRENDTVVKITSPYGVVWWNLAPSLEATLKLQDRVQMGTIDTFLDKTGQLFGELMQAQTGVQFLFAEAMPPATTLDASAQQNARANQQAITLKHEDVGAITWLPNENLVKGISPIRARGLLQQYVMEVRGELLATAEEAFAREAA